jgi:4-amino-4-deoxy-L-arabinose transferase-like glycosyltransferase
MTSAANLTKFSLLGEINLQRATSANHIPFHGATYSYLILPLILISNFKVLPITLFFAFFNLLTAFIFFKITKKLFGKIIAIFSLFFFLFSDVMIHHSLFAWILNPLPLLGILNLWFLTKLIRSRKLLLPIFWIGLMAGFGFGLQNLYLPFGVLMLILSIIFSKRKVLAASAYSLGAIIGNLPMVIFDLRHDFYHVRTMWQYFLDVYVNHTVSGFTDYYHFLYLFPFFFLGYALVTYLLYRIKKPLALVPLLLFLNATLNSPKLNLSSSTGMPAGITLSTLESAAGLIAADIGTSPLAGGFNVATLWDFDTRANPLRYLLKYYYQLTPQPYENYGAIDALYVFAPENYDVIKPRVWELSVYTPYRIVDLPLNAPGYRLYKLSK